MSKHTSGTWEIATLADFRNGCRKGYLVCQVGSFIVLSGEEVRPESNAKLIAAVPEMLEALKEAVSDLEAYVDAAYLEGIALPRRRKRELNEIQRYKAIIAKAEGGDHAA